MSLYRVQTDTGSQTSCIICCPYLQWLSFPSTDLDCLQPPLKDLATLLPSLLLVSSRWGVWGEGGA